MERVTYSINNYRQRNKTVEQGKENNKINEEEFIQQRKIAKEVFI